ncbi:MAG: 50S ribosomal protein L21 [Planctomycetota bacterium]
MYAIIKDGGHQYRVSSGDSILVERTGLVKGETLTFDKVLYADGKIGTPLVDGATVEAEVLGDMAGPKIYVVKYKRRKNYRRRFGHRQHFTKVQIKSINA